MAASTNIHGFNIGGNNNSFDQRGHFYRAFLSGNVSGMLVKQNSTPNMTVLVEHGSALLNKNTTSASIAEIKSDTSVTIDTANTSNPRIDSVVIYEDTSVAIPTVEANYWQDGAGGRFKIVSLPGTAAASPVALTDASIQSAIGAGKPWTRLADVTVPANSTTIVNSNISDRRVKIQTPLTGLNGGTTAGFLANDTSGNVTVMPKVDFSYGGSSTGLSTSASIIKCSNKNYDVQNNYSTSTGLFTAPVAGTYRFSASVIINTSNGGNNLGGVYIYKNGTNIRALTIWAVGAISSQVGGGNTVSLQLAAGDTVGLYANNSIATSYGSIYFDGWLTAV